MSPRPAWTAPEPALLKGSMPPGAHCTCGQLRARPARTPRPRAGNGGACRGCSAGVGGRSGRGKRDTDTEGSVQWTRALLSPASNTPAAPWVGLRAGRERNAEPDV